jgi:hypothetical protein
MITSGRWPSAALAASSMLSLVETTAKSSLSAISVAKAVREIAWPSASATVMILSVI